jgi:hemerythrin-like metal-binding protein
MTLRFNDKYKIGIAELDSEHEALLFSLKKILIASHKSEGESPLANMEALLNSLLKTVQSHSRREEEFLEKINHPAKEAHKIEHRRLECEIEDDIVKTRVTNQHNMLAEKLWKWIESHIVIWDMELKQPSL